MYNFIADLKSRLVLCMEENTCHGMVVYLSQRFSSMLYFLHFFISSIYEFHIDAEIRIFKTRDM